MEYFFCDTHKELPETYEYLDRIKARLGIKIHYLSAEYGFDHWLRVYGGYLPSPKSRWCTRQMKIAPLEKFVGDDEAILPNLPELLTNQAFLPNFAQPQDRRLAQILLLE